MGRLAGVLLACVTCVLVDWLTGGLVSWWAGPPDDGLTGWWAGVLVGRRSTEESGGQMSRYASRSSTGSQHHRLNGLMLTTELSCNVDQQSVGQARDKVGLV